MNTLIITLQVLGVIIFAVTYASFFEWGLHKYVMHRTFLGYRGAYEAHHETHHVIFGAGKTYSLSNHPPEKKEKNKKTIPMAWWHWIFLISVASLPVVLITIVFLPVWWPTVVTVIVFILYYCTYEYFHWCMHDPTGLWFERRRWFIWSNKRHNLHHKNPKTNFNVVLPIADLALGTFRH